MLAAKGEWSHKNASGGNKKKKTPVNLPYEFLRKAAP